MIRVEKEFTLNQFEQILDSISSGNQDLTLPNNIKAEVVGGLAALTQLVITWARKSSSDHFLRIYSDDIDSVSIGRFMNTIHGLSAVNFSKNIKTFNNDNILQRSELMQHSIPFVKAMHANNLLDLKEFNKSTIQLMCIDNAKKLLWPQRLYKKSDVVRDKGDFEYLLAACYEAIGWEKYQDLALKLIKPAARLLHEAFLNTHEHARKDFHGDVLSRSVRGVFIGHRMIPIKQMAESADEHQPLKKYFSEWRPINDKMSQAHFLDISIFDSGSGLAQTWLARNDQLNLGIIEDGISLQKELDAVLSCLRKGFSTKPGYTNGNGLYRIMEVVRSAGGFLRIRTGRLSLVRAFPFDAPKLDADDVFMEDALVGGVPERARSWAEGTTLSVLLPLNQRINK